MIAAKPPRVMHVVENLHRGSVENWLLNMAAHAREKGVPIDWTFYCALGEPGQKDELARELGISVVLSPVPIGRKLAFATALRTEIQRGGYDVLHCQHDLVSGLYLAAALGLGLRKRIVHVHNADEEVLTDHRLKKAVFRPVLRTVCLKLADLIAANSNHSLDTFLAGRPRRPGRDLVHYLGVDASAFLHAKGDRLALRRNLGLADDAPILLFAGRMTPEKNPLFALEVLAELRSRRPDVIGLFVGTGSLETALLTRIAELGLDASTRVLGWRDDVPEIMCSADWFILPHPEEPMEGFGLAVVEAQLAGLRLLLSHGIADDPLLPGASVRRLSLNDDPGCWAQAAIDLLAAPAPSREAAVAALRASPMEMDNALADLRKLHA